MFYTDVDIKSKERLYHEVDNLMVKNGFAADLPYWRRTSDETIASIFIENYKSSYEFHVSLGVYVFGLSNKKTQKPQLKHMHAWTRLSQLTPVTAVANGHIALKGDGSVNTEKIVADVIEAIKTVGVEVLNDFFSLDGTKRVLSKYGDMRWQIEPLLKEMLFGNCSVAIRGELPLQDWEIAGSVNPNHKT